MNRGVAVAVAIVLVLVLAGVVTAEQPDVRLKPSYEFSFPGGLGPFLDKYTFVPPNTLTVQRSFTFKEDGPPRSCAYQVPDCGEADVVDLCALEAQLLKDHVLALWPEEGETVYGGDTRHYDGGVFTIVGPGTGLLTVGELCRDHGAECSGEHQALLDLRRVFTELSRQSRVSPGCRTLEN